VSDKDQYFNDTNFLEAIKEGTNLFKYSTTPLCTILTIHYPVGRARSTGLSSTPPAPKVSTTTSVSKPTMTSIGLGLQYRPLQLRREAHNRIVDNVEGRCSMFLGHQIRRKSWVEVGRGPTRQHPQALESNSWAFGIQEKQENIRHL